MRLTDFVEEGRHGRQRYESVRNSGRKVEGCSIAGGQFDFEMPAQSRRGLSDIDRYIEYRAMNDVNQLRLRPNDLIVQSPDDIPGGDRQIVLWPIDIDARFPQGVAPVGFLKESSLVAMNRELKDQHAGNRSLLNLQCFSPWLSKSAFFAQNR